MNKLSTALNILIAVMVVIIGGAFFYLKTGSQGPNPAKVGETELSSNDLDKIVNKYIKTTNEEALRTQIMAEKTLFETKKRLAEIQRLNQIKQEKEIASIPLTQQIHKESSNNANSPAFENSIAKMKEALSDEQMGPAEKKEYARQWIQNARKEGYLLELSDDLEIIKYTPIRKPSQQDDSVDSGPSD